MRPCTYLCNRLTQEFKLLGFVAASRIRPQGTPGPTGSNSFCSKGFPGCPQGPHSPHGVPNALLHLTYQVETSFYPLRQCKKQLYWTSGLGINAHNTGLKDSLVNDQADDDEVSAFITDVFGNSEEHCPNDDSKTPFDVVCWLKYGGLCKRDPWQKVAQAMHHQVNALLASWKECKAGAMLRLWIEGCEFSCHWGIPSQSSAPKVGTLGFGV